MSSEKCDGSCHSGFGTFLIALLGGAAAGATVAYFTTPRSGADSRRRIHDVADEARETATRLPIAVRRASEAARDAFNEALREGADS
jgi:gas vesicle protein